MYYKQAELNYLMIPFHPDMSNHIVNHITSIESKRLKEVKSFLYILNLQRGGKKSAHTQKINPLFMK